MQCSGCHTQHTVLSAVISRGQHRACAVCRTLADKQAAAHQRVFTDAELKEITLTIRNTVFGVIGARDEVQSLNADTQVDDLSQAAWCELLRKPLIDLPILSIYKMSSAIAKNRARRVFNKRVSKRVNPTVNEEGHEVSVTDTIPAPSPESAYDYAHVEQEDTLRTALQSLTAEERAAAIQGSPTMIERLQHACDV